MARDEILIRLESDDFSCEKVQVHEFLGKEAIGQVPSYELSIACLDPDALSIDALAGSDATIVFERLESGHELRRIHTTVVEVVDSFDTEASHRGFRLVLMPRAFRAGLVETQEIFLDKSLPKIIEQKLSLVGLGHDDVELRLRGEYPVLEFVVQYKESDLNFISRLCEHAGISFFFEHVDGRDVLVFTDHPGGFPRFDPPELPYRPRGEARSIHRIEARKRLSPQRYEVHDYNYRTPQLLGIVGSCDADFGYGGGVVEYGAHFKTPEEGKALAQVRAEERCAKDEYFTGESAAVDLAAGVSFVLEGHPQLGDLPLLVVEVTHHAKQSVGTHGGAPGERSYKNTFRATDARRTYRPPRVTPKPRIHGLITGIVELGPEGEASDFAKIDDHGRYTVRFLFDTAPPGEQKASRPVRMIQPHAGPGYGMHFPLKPGIEVLLAFIDGDPDRPLIVGSVPNPLTPSPVTAGNSTVHRIRTASGITIDMDDAT